MEDANKGMMSQKRMRWTRAFSREETVAFTTASVLTTFFVLLILIFKGNPVTIAMFPLFALLLVVISRFKLALMALVTSVFVDYHVMGLSSAVLFAFVFGLSFPFSQKHFGRKEFVNPMTAPILIYGLCIVPSFLNAAKPLTSLYLLSNVFAFAIVLYALVAKLRTYDDLRKVATAYIVLALVNALHVFVQSWKGENRPFGFAGLMYVDYSALAVCITAAMSVVSRGKQRVFLVLLSSIIAAVLILTQTRNTWLSALITLSILVIYLLVHPEVVGITRKRVLALTLVGSLVIVGSSVLIVSLNPRIEKRATELTGQAGNRTNEPREFNSLVTRVFIWDTALNAFLAHPYIGIGVYAFPYSSHQYSKIPELFYKLYVKGLTTHQTHLAVLAETGIIGAMGFIIFVVAALRSAFKAIRQASNEQGQKTALVAATGLVYCMVSMFFTDAWLWGQLIIVLAIVLGIVLANQRINTPFDIEKAVSR